MRNLQKQFEKVIIWLAFKMDADPIFQRRIAIATLFIIALFGMICGYNIFYAACWMACNEPKLFSLFFAVFGMLFWGWIWYTEKR